MKALGSALMELAAGSLREFVMCAPFAKEGVVSRVVAAVPEGVPIRLFTRWRPDEVAAGVSDTGVLAVVRSRGGVVLLHDRLHAKYYRNERAALIGSANLTATALGWTRTPNLELLIPSNGDKVSTLEQHLHAHSILATDEMAREVDAIAEMMPTVDIDEAIDQQAEARIWIPALRMPSDLYSAYDVGFASLASRSGDAAAADLRVLDLPVGLSQDQFYRLVGHRLRGQALFAEIDEYLKEPRRFGEMRNLVSRIAGLDRDQSEQSWQTIMRWMLEFLPTRYSHNIFRHSEVVSPAAEKASSDR